MCCPLRSSHIILARHKAQVSGDVGGETSCVEARGLFDGPDSCPDARGIMEAGLNLRFAFG